MQVSFTAFARVISNTCFQSSTIYTQLANLEQNGKSHSTYILVLVQKVKGF